MLTWTFSIFWARKLALEVWHALTESPYTVCLKNSTSHNFLMEHPLLYKDSTAHWTLGETCIARNISNFSSSFQDGFWKCKLLNCIATKLLRLPVEGMFHKGPLEFSKWFKSAIICRVNELNKIDVFKSSQKCKHVFKKTVFVREKTKNVYNFRRRRRGLNS